MTDKKKTKETKSSSSKVLLVDSVPTTHLKPLRGIKKAQAAVPTSHLQAKSPKKSSDDSK